MKELLFNDSAPLPSPLILAKKKEKKKLSFFFMTREAKEKAFCKRGNALRRCECFSFESWGLSSRLEVLERISLLVKCMQSKSYSIFGSNDDAEAS